MKTHPRQPPGGRSTDHTDYPEQLTPYTLRDPQRIISKAQSHGPHIGCFTEALLAGTFPWAKLRQAQQLLRLGEKYGWPRLDAACQRALAFELINVKRVEVIIRQHLEQEELPARAVDVRIIPIQARFARSATSFAHHPTLPPLTPSQGDHQCQK